MNSIKFLKIVIIVMLTLIITDNLGSYFLNSYINVQNLRFNKEFPLNDAGIREDLSLKDLKNLKKEKIVILGNSVVLGFRIPSSQKNLTGAMQVLMDQSEPDSQIKFVNAGLYAGTFATEFPLLTEKLLMINPKLVIWVPGANDFLNVQKMPDEERVSKTQNKTDFQKKWYKLTFYRQLSLYLFLRLNVFISDWNYNSDYDIYSTDFFLKARPAEDVSKISDEVKRLSGLLTTKNIPLLVVFIPTRKFNKEFNWSDAKPFLQLNEAITRRGIPTAQFFEEFKEDCQDCFLDNEHLNEKGNRFFAELLLKQIQKR